MQINLANYATQDILQHFKPNLILLNEILLAAATVAKTHK